MRAIKRLIYAPTFGARGFAALAAVVSRAAEIGDAVAIAIVHHASESLAHSVIMLARKLDFTARPIPVAPSGGAFDHVFGLRTAFIHQMQMRCASAVVVEPKLPPVLGALLLALKCCDTDMKQAVAALYYHHHA